MSTRPLNNPRQWKSLRTGSSDGTRSPTDWLDACVVGRVAARASDSCAGARKVPPAKTSDAINVEAFNLLLPNLLNVLLCQPAFGVEGGFAAHGGGGNGLLISRIANVAGGEDAFHARQCAVRLGQHDETAGIEF